MAMRGQESRPAARSTRRKLAGGIDVLEQRVLRPKWQVRKETRSGYDHPVANGVLDRQEWAKVVRELLDVEGAERKHGAKTRLAGKAGVTTRTVDTWLTAQVDVQEANVRRVATAYELNAMDLLIRVGLYSVDQLPRVSPAQMNVERQRVLDNADLDDEAKADILRKLDEWEAADEELIRQLRQKDQERRAQRITDLIEQRRGA